MLKLVAVVVGLLGFALACDVLDTVPNPFPNPDKLGPDAFYFSLDTNVLIDGHEAEPIVIYVNRSWAPLGSDRLYSLVSDGYYNQAAFFRVVPDFVVQFGISASPEESAKWNTVIPDDPVVLSNTQWTVSYATGGPNTRTAQLFINYADNSRLDDMGFSPFGMVVSGFQTALAIYNPTPGDSNGANQTDYMLLGNDWLLDEFPDISLITCGVTEAVAVGSKGPSVSLVGDSHKHKLSDSQSTAITVISSLVGTLALVTVLYLSCSRSKAYDYQAVQQDVKQAINSDAYEA